MVLVDVKKLLECADRDDTDYVLKSVNDWHAGKVKGIREFLDPDNPRVPEMPYVTISARRAHGLLGLLGVNRNGVVAFRNGQHRARYLAHAGALCMPVEVHEREAELLRQMCAAPGTASAEYGETWKLATSGRFRRPRRWSARLAPTRLVRRDDHVREHEEACEDVMRVAPEE